jgi:hypothetical protein
VLDALNHRAHLEHIRSESPLVLDAGRVSGFCPFIFMLHPKTYEALPVRWTGKWSRPQIVLGYYGRAFWATTPWLRGIRVCVANIYRCGPACALGLCACLL